MVTRPGKEAWDKLTPGQQAAVKAAEAKQRTPEKQIEHARVAEEATREFPPLEVDETLAGFVASLKLERERVGLSLADVGERCGMDRAAIQKIESGKVANPTYSTLKAIAGALGCRVGLTLERASAAVEK